MPPATTHCLKKTLLPSRAISAKPPSWCPSPLRHDVPDTRHGFVGESSASKEVQKPPLKGPRGIWMERQLGSPTAKKTAKLADKGA